MSRSRLRGLWPLLLVVSLPLLLAGCSEAKVSPASGLTLDRQGNAVDPAMQRIFRLGIGDKLKVDVYGEPELTGEAEVTASGTVALPLVGDVPAKDKTLDEFADMLRRKLEAGYLKNAKVSVQVLNYRPFFVQGEVRHGGEFPYKPGLAVADAIALAGGYTYRAVTDSIMLRRQGEAEPRRIGLGDAAVPVLPGDNFLVEERFF